MVDARKNEVALLALAQSNSTTSAASLLDSEATSGLVATGSESDDSVCGSSLNLNSNNCDITITQQEQEIRDLTNDFSICASTLGHATTSATSDVTPSDTAMGMVVNHPTQSVAEA